MYVLQLRMALLAAGLWSGREGVWGGWEGLGGRFGGGGGGGFNSLNKDQMELM